MKNVKNVKSILMTWADYNSVFKKVGAAHVRMVKRLSEIRRRNYLLRI